MSLKTTPIFSLFFSALCLCASVAIPAKAQTLTQITDTLKNADGTNANGRLVLSWDPFTTSDNFTIDGGTLTYTITNGVVSLQLAPNAGATPAGTSYRVRYYLTNGASYVETWVVPATGPVAIRAIRTLPAPTPVDVDISSLNGLTTVTQTFANDTNVTIASSGSVHTLGWTGALALARGGTNQTSWTAARCVRVNNAGTALEAFSADCGGGGTHNLLSATHPDTAAASPVLGDLLYGNATPAWTRLVGNTATTKQFLSQTGTGAASAAPAWSALGDGDIPAAITRDSEVNVQGTANEIASSGSGVAPTLSLALQLNLSAKEIIGGATPVQFEGATDNNFYTRFTFTDPTANRAVTFPNADSNTVQPLTCTGTDKVSAISAAGVMTCTADQTGGGANHNLLSATHSDTTTGAVARGDLVVGQTATPTWQRLAIGAANRFLGSDGTDATWTAATPSGSVLGTGRALTGGAGIAALGDLSADRTVETDSQEANFLKDGGVTDLTCGASNPGKAQVMDDGTLQWCDGQATSAIQHSALGDTNGAALSGDSATSFFSTGTLEDARLSGNVVLENQSNAFTAGDQDFGAAASLEVPNSAGAGPTASALIAYDTTSNTLEYGENGTNRTLVNTARSITAGSGLTGGGDLSANRTLDVAVTAPIEISTDTVACSTCTTASNTQTFTNKTYDAEGTGNVLSVVSKIDMIAAGCDNTTAAAAFDLPTSNGPSKSCFGTSPHRFGALDFADGASALTASVQLDLPADWTSTGGVDIRLIWFSGSTSTNSAVWTVATACVADGEDVLNPTYNTTQTVADANNATASTRNSASITGITMTGCAAGETLHLKVGRDPTHGSDTLAATASLRSIELTLRRQL